MITKTFYVAGVQHRPDAVKVADDLVGRNLSEQVVRLVGEPSNKYDPFAVKVVVNGYHIGYVPRAAAKEFWAFHNNGFKADAELAAFDPTAPTWEMFQVVVTFTK